MPSRRGTELDSRDRRPLAPRPGPGLAGVRRHGQLATRPGRLALALVLLLAATVGFALAAVMSLNGRQASADAIATTSHPSLIHAANLYVHLSDADATASQAFLTGGIEPAPTRERYLRDLALAAEDLEALSRAAGQSEEVRAALGTIAERLPVYSGLIETARANNRQGFPVGAAYLRQASTDLRTTILPAVESVYEAAAERLDSDYAAGTSGSAPAVLVGAGCAVIALILCVQVWLARRTHRVFNVGLATATVLLVLLTAVGAVALVEGADDLDDARRDGSTATATLASTRILYMRMQTDENLALVARGGGAAFLADFEMVRGRLADAGLTADLARILSDDADGRIRTHSQAYFSAHETITGLESEGRFAEATVHASAVEAEHFAGIIATLDDAIATSEERFADRIADARGSYGLAHSLIVLGVAVACVLIAAGLVARLREYR